MSKHMEMVKTSQEEQIRELNERHQKFLSDKINLVRI
jgi:hypothetical protein